MKPDTDTPTIELSLDERNLAHVLTALAFAGIADADPDATPDDRCWWANDMFILDIPLNRQDLFTKAYQLVMSMRWIAGIGATDKRKIAASAHHGLFVADGFTGCNPLLNYKLQGAENSIFKCFAGNESPGNILARQQEVLMPPEGVADWLLTVAPRGKSGDKLGRWRFDASVTSHAYDLGFTSDKDQTGFLDPFCPAIELLSMAGAAFFSAPQAWLVVDEEIVYSIWKERVSLPLAQLAASGLVDGIDTHTFALTTRGNSYGQGKYYKHFPHAAEL